MLLRSLDKFCLQVTVPNLTKAEQPFYKRSHKVLHPLSSEILDFGQQLSVCVNVLFDGKATE